MRKTVALCMIGLFLFSGIGLASLSDAATWTKDSAVNFVQDLGSAGADTIKFATGAVWAASEIVFYPFRIFIITKTVTE